MHIAAKTAMEPKIPSERSLSARHLAALLVCLFAALGLPSSASAVSMGVQFRNYDPGEVAIAKLSGATIYRMHVDYRQTSGANVNGGWGVFEGAVKAAWERGITVLPILERSVLNSSNQEEWRFLTLEDGSWGDWRRWTKAAVERFGINGSFWDNKANPRPITAWEVWNETNLPANNPVRSQAQCQNSGHPYIASANTCVQPQNYGRFLNWTSGALQEGSINKTAHGTTVLFAGIFLPYSNASENYRTYLEQVNQETNVPNSYSGVGIHPYGLAAGTSQTTEEIDGVRSVLNDHITGGTSKTLWITELGWSVGGTTDWPAGGHPVSETEQASLLTSSFNWINGAPAEKKIETVIWYNLRDYSNNNRHWAEKCGLLTLDGSYRPAFNAFQAETGAPLTERPSVEARPATEILEDSARLNGWVHPHTLPTTYYFDYGTTTSYGNSVPIPRASTSGAIGVWVNATVSGLQPGTTYYYRVVAENEIGLSITAASSFRTPRTYVAFQSNQNRLWTYTTGGGYFFNTTLGMSSTTSPAIAGTPNGGYVAAFQNDLGELWTYGSETGYFNTKLGMMAGTSPSISVKPNGKYVVAFQANTGHLWTFTSEGNTFNDTGFGMMAGTSPSIAVRSDGGYVTAFQTNTGQLWTWAPGAGYWAIGLGMDSRTSPMIAMEPDNNWIIALQATTHTLWTFSSANGYHDTELGMQPGASPSIAVRSDGGYVTAFQTNTGQLWTWAPGAGYWAIGLGMDSRTSPMIAMEPDNNWIIALQATTHTLWTFSSANGYHDTELGMQPGASPSIEVR